MRNNLGLSQRIKRVVVCIAVGCVGLGLFAAQTRGYRSARSFDSIGQTAVYRCGWPLVYAERFDPRAGRRHNYAPHWSLRLCVNFACVAIGAASAWLVFEQFSISASRFRLATLFAVIGVVAALICAAPFEQKLATPETSWGFVWAAPPHRMSHYLRENVPLVASTMVALACSLYLGERIGWRCLCLACRNLRRTKASPATNGE